MTRKTWGAACVALLLVACGGAGEQDADVGGANVQVRGDAAMWAGSESTVVKLTVQKVPGAAKEYTLSPGSGSWGVSLDRLPTGEYQFCASATDGALTFGPTCAPVTITRNRMAEVQLVVQQASAPTTIHTDSPLIRALALSDGAPYFGAPVTMTVVASDATAQHGLQYLWSATCLDGTASVNDVADATQATATLTSDCTGTEKVSITVTDPDQDVASVVEFRLRYSAQGADVVTALNRWPDITSISTPDAQLEPGERTSVTVVASDSDDAALTYAWSKDCAADADVFDAPDQATTGFLAPPDVAAPYDCKLTVTVSDGNGGSATGSIIVHVGVVAPTIPVFDELPDTLPYNLPSLGFQATQTAEFGDTIALEPGTGRHGVKATVVMSTWATVAYQHPITLNLYDPSDLATPIASVTQTFAIPARPAADPTCSTPTAWRAGDGACYNGFAFAITFDLTGITLPDTLAYGIAYNTNTWGKAPLHQPGPYESLNVGLVGDGATAASTAPSVGSDLDSDVVLWNTSTAAWYGDGGAGGTGTFRADTKWTGYAPAVEFFAY